MAEVKSKVKVQKAKVAEKKTVNLSIPAYTLSGAESGKLALPEAIFGQKVNKKLLAQLVRVYSNNQKTLTGSTKTRGQVQGSTVKIYAQKGTGRARHGGKRAPTFVGGGIVFGPSPRKVTLDFPKKMKKSALLSALSARVLDAAIFGISEVEKATGKTKELITFLKKVSGDPKKAKSALIITGEKMDQLFQSARNIANVTVLPVNLINAYEVLKHETLFLTKEAIEKLANPKVSEPAEQPKLADKVEAPKKKTVKKEVKK